MLWLTHDYSYSFIQCLRRHYGLVCACVFFLLYWRLVCIEQINTYQVAQSVLLSIQAFMMNLTITGNSTDETFIANENSFNLFVFWYYDRNTWGKEWNSQLTETYSHSRWIRRKFSNLNCIELSEFFHQCGKNMFYPFNVIFSWTVFPLSRTPSYHSRSNQTHDSLSDLCIWFEREWLDDAFVRSTDFSNAIGLCSTCIPLNISFSASKYQMKKHHRSVCMEKSVDLRWKELWFKL